MLQAISQSTKAFFDTVVLRLEGKTTLRSVSDFYGIPFLDLYHKPSWRAALNAGSMGHRGTFKTLFNFLREATRSLDEETEFLVKSDTELTIVAGPPDDAILGRIIEIQETYYMVVDIVGNDVHISGIKTGYWSSGDLLARFNLLQQIKVNTCSFFISEPTPGNEVTKSTLPVEYSIFNKPEYVNTILRTALSDACKVYINFTAELELSPATYLQPNAGPRPANEPYGGHLQEDESESGQDDAFGGPHPPYLGSGTVFDLLLQSMKSILPAGVYQFSHFKDPS